MKISELFGKPKIISIIANANEGKSNLIYYLIEEVKKDFPKTKIWVYGLRCPLNKVEVFHSINELEVIKDSIIFVDEFMSLIDLDNRKNKQKVENTLRLIFHNNNVLILVGLPENFKKFISSKTDVFIYKRVTFADFINGSTAKQRIMEYNGYEKGSTILNLDKGEAILYNKRYSFVNIPYLKKYDTKKDNPDILQK